MALAISLTAFFAPAAPAKAGADEPILMVGLPVEKPATGVKTIQAQALVAAPPSFVWQRLTDYNGLSSFLPGYQKSVLSVQGGTQIPGGFL
jgi:hypothetical protein